MFEPRQVHPVGARRVLRNVVEFPCLLCSECGSWRRVDDDTLSVYSNETYFDGHMVVLEQDFVAVDSGVVSDLLRYLRQLSGPVTAEMLQEFWSASNLRLRLWHARSADCVALSVHKSIVHECGSLSPALLSVYHRYWSALPGPKFCCSMLVNGSCDEQCDWKRAVECVHDFTGLRKLSHDPVLLLDPELETVMRAEFRFYAAESVPQERCAVQGCDVHVFQLRHKHGLAIHALESEGGREDVRWILCNVHFQRLCAVGSALSSTFALRCC